MPPSAPLLLYLELEPRLLRDTLRQGPAGETVGEVAGEVAAVGDSLLLRRTGEGLSALAPVGEPRLLPVPDVLAAAGTLSLRGVPDLPGWQLVSTLDAQAVYAPLRRQTLAALGVLAALALAAGTVLLVWRRGEHLRRAVREAGMRRYYEEALRNSADIFVLYDEDGRVVDTSKSALAALGHSRDGVLRQSLASLLPGEAYTCALERMAGMVPGESRSFITECLRADGDRFVLEGHVGLVEVGGRHYYHCIGRDVTRQREEQTRLRLASSFFEHSVAAIVISDAGGCIRSVNPAFTRITGYTQAEVEGHSVRLLNAQPEDDAAVRMRAQLARDGHWEGDLRGRRQCGGTYPRRLLASVHRDAAGRVEQYISIFTDLSRLRQAEGQAEYLACHDRLTGLPNRMQLERHLPELIALAEARSTSLTLALLNVDRFQAVNESLGHAQGDALLVALAQRLRVLFPGAEDLYRYGCDEFMLVMRGHPVTHALAIGQVRAAVARPLNLDGHTLLPTVSVGIASMPEHARESDVLLRNVGAAMRRAKSQGRNTWRLYQPEMNATAYDDMLLLVELRQAMERRELVLHTQPQFRLADGALVGMEELLRWPHAERGMVPPARFIPLAEASGLMEELGSWVLREACGIWAAWRELGFDPPPMAINVSAPQFRHPGFLGEVAAAMREHGLPPQALEMELTESLVMDDTETAIGTMQGLVAMGIRLAIDDFGTGYSSLAYLRRFPVAKLKIDRSFVLDLGLQGSEQGAAIAKAVIGMAKSLNLKVVAEGVETAAQRDFLRTHGCDEVQGYLYGKPLPVEDMAGLLQRRAVPAR